MGGTTAYNLILGPMEMGNTFNLVLFGIVTMQYYQYMVTFNDPRWLKNTITFVYTLDIVQTAIMVFMVWEYTITYYDAPAHLAVSSWSIGVIPFFSVPISWIVQFFFAWRIYQLGEKQKAVPVIVMGLSVIQGLAGIGCGIGAFILTDVTDYYKLQPIAIVWFVGSIVCDALITCAMLYHLLSARTGFRDTDLLITTICKGVVETGLATTTIVILDAIFFFRLSMTNMHLCVVMIAGKTYSNSMLYMLNSRQSYRTVSRAGTTTFTNENGVQVARAGSGSPARRHDLTELVFERPRLRGEGDSFSTSRWLETGVTGAHGQGGDSTDASANAGVVTLTTLGSDGKPLARAQTRSTSADADDERDRDRKVELEEPPLPSAIGIKGMHGVRGSSISADQSTVLIATGPESARTTTTRTAASATRSLPAKFEGDDKA